MSSSLHGSSRDIGVSQGMAIRHTPHTLISLASHHITSHHFLYICGLRLVVEINSQHLILLSHLWRYIPAQ